MISIFMFYNFSELVALNKASVVNSVSAIVDSKLVFLSFFCFIIE